MRAADILHASYPKELVKALLLTYGEIESNFAVKKWKASELDAGHFVEVARRLVDHSLSGSFTKIGKSLPNFSDQELKRYEQLQGDESLRILIPRVLKSIYNLRNKRGVGHLGEVSPNEMDATLILYSAKWVLAEFVRLASKVDPEKAQQAVDAIIERRLDIIWKDGDKARVLVTTMNAREQILLLLYDKNGQTESELRLAIEYKNPSDFRKILRKLHASREIEYETNAPVKLTSKGLISAETIILKLKSDK